VQEIYKPGITVSFENKHYGSKNMKNALRMCCDVLRGIKTIRTNQQK
jgi:hypothetical protein